MESDFQKYTNANDTSPYPPKGVYFKKYGKMIEVYGAITPTKDIQGSTDEHIICYIPADYMPEYTITRVCQGSNGAKWLLRVRPADNADNTNARLTFSRYGISRYNNSSDYLKAPAGSWLTFHETWLIAQK